MSKDITSYWIDYNKSPILETIGNIVQKFISKIKLDKILIIEKHLKALRHLYLFPSPNIRMIELEDEII